MICNCPACDNDASYQAIACPNCGFNIKEYYYKPLANKILLRTVTPIYLYFLVTFYCLYFGVFSNTHWFFANNLFDLYLLNWFVAPLCLLVGAHAGLKESDYGGILWGIGFASIVITIKSQML
jgi:hypothetical protein